MAAITLEDLNSNLEQQNDILNKVERLSSKMSNSITTLVKSLTGFKGDELEASREAKPGVMPLDGKAGADGGDFDLRPFLAGLIPGIGALLAGLSGAILASFDETFNDIARSFVTFGTKIGEKTRGLVTSFLKAFGPEGRIGKLFLVDKLVGEQGKLTQLVTKAISSAKTSMLISLGLLGEDGKEIAIVKKGVQGAFNPLTKFNERLQALFGPESRLGKATTAIKEAFTFTEESKVFKILSTLGDILKKIFVPIGIIFTAYDTVKGTLDGYEKAGGIGAVIGGITGFFESVIGAPANLLKSAVSYILGFFGFKEAEKWLDENVDFEKMISDIGDGLINFLQAPIEALKNALRAILPEKVADYLFEEEKELTPEQQQDQTKKKIKSLGLGNAFEEGGIDAARSKAVELYSGRKLENVLGILNELDGAQDASKSYDDAALRKLRTTGPTTASTLTQETAEMTARANQGPAPVIIQDNSQRVQGGSSSQGVVMPTNPWDAADPYAGYA